MARTRAHLLDSLAADDFNCRLNFWDIELGNPMQKHCCLLTSPYHAARRRDKVHRYLDSPGNNLGGPPRTAARHDRDLARTHRRWRALGLDDALEEIADIETQVIKGLATGDFALTKGTIGIRIDHANGSLFRIDDDDK
jgi:hypothetical protein